MNTMWLALTTNLYNLQKKWYQLMVLPFITPPLPSTSPNHNLSPFLPKIKFGSSWCWMGRMSLLLGYIILTTGWLYFKAREEQGRRQWGGTRGGADGGYKARRLTRKGVEGSVLKGRKGRRSWRSGKEEKKDCGERSKERGNVKGEVKGRLKGGDKKEGRKRRDK